MLFHWNLTTHFQRYCESSVRLIRGTTATLYRTKKRLTNTIYRDVLCNATGGNLSFEKNMLWVCALYTNIVILTSKHQCSNDPL